MVKAKVVLTAVAALAVIGGAFAFKASRTPNRFYKTGTILTTIGGVPTTVTRCTVPFNTLYSTAPQVVGQAPVVITSFYTTATTSSICPTTTLYTLNEG